MILRDFIKRYLSYNIPTRPQQNVLVRDFAYAIEAILQLFGITDNLQTQINNLKPSVLPGTGTFDIDDNLGVFMFDDN